MEFALCILFMKHSARVYQKIALSLRPILEVGRMAIGGGEEESLDL